ncbi:hypothetical protein J7I42_21625 [Niastella sp. MAH-29]|uniref:S9 family peptidase n=1 Tax=Niastella soli TaxID=2821487 RepID=A0ABS3YYB0_9BACT|nr:hypothetical protein [Niastella soli]
MLKKLLLFSAAAFFYLQPYAQNTGKLTWGDIEKRSRYMPSLATVMNGSGTDVISLGFIFQNRGMTPVLSRFDEKLNQLYEKELFASDKNINFNTIFNLNGNIVMFTKQYDKDEKFTTLQATQIDQTTLGVTNTKEVGKFDAISKRNQAGITVKPSPDKNYVMVMANAPYNKNENEKYFISVWDNKMNKAWEKMITLPYADKFVVVDEFRVSNEGEVYVMCKHYDKEVNRERIRENGESIPSYKYKFFIYGKDDARPREHTLDFQNKFVHDVSLEFNTDGNITMLGLYKNKYNSYISGSFMAIFDKNTKLITMKRMQEFSFDGILAMVKKDGNASLKTDDPGLYTRFRIMGTNKRNDGSVDLLTELNYEYIVRTYNSSTHSYSEYPVYVAEDIVVINYKKDGNVVYTRVPKAQKQAYMDHNISFKWMNQGNNLVLFYNDSKKNLNRDLEKGVRSWGNESNTEFVMAVVNDKGELQRQSLFSNKGMGVIAKIPSCESVSPNTLVIYAEKMHRLARTRCQLGCLRFD